MFRSMKFTDGSSLKQLMGSTASSFAPARQGSAGGKAIVGKPANCYCQLPSAHPLQKRHKPKIIQPFFLELCGG